MNYIIIVAGGKGLRMGSETPKQFLPIGGKPILMRTIERFKAYDKEMKVIVVLPESQQSYWKELCGEYDFNIEHQIANGGNTRFESSRNGLAMIPEGEDGLVGIHDGVRPFVSLQTIARCYDEALKTCAAIPVMPITETLRMIEKNGNSKNVLRSDYRSVQTPQVFNIMMLKMAYAQEFQDSFTDDASVMEQFGCKVSMVEGNCENIKITTPTDMKFAATLLNE
ncbi:2-C-methyl-D-erythritol 4-phosphate cytidylyltransferase [Prevotella corporis]|uniref:2-C-methyl-D-erythritol 4-phosphate cytidylyltransferase n=1 Tax=Prevotella corporis TaxID=28128 RepID=UPI0023F9B54B|nr:2-C-methyl-D-erythritol 4-phosphate cytidylyltransferase [Prevotella corporis]